jgi:hypothetical protein
VRLITATFPADPRVVGFAGLRQHRIAALVKLRLRRINGFQSETSTALTRPSNSDGCSLELGWGVTRASRAAADEVSEAAFELAASALEAALLEHDTIKTLRPAYNNVQRAAVEPRIWYSTRRFDAATPTPDFEYCMGPVASLGWGPQ